MDGAQALQKILDDLAELKTKFDELKLSTDLVLSNIKFLNNRASGLMRAETNINTQPIAEQTPNNRVLLPSVEKNKLIYDETPGSLTYKKVFGRLFDDMHNPIDS